MGYGPIRHFTDIVAWKLARDLRVAIYRLTKILPTEEKFGLATQMKRAAISCTANIAEGYGRFHYQENVQFCRISRGSMYELQDHLITCTDNNYVDKIQYQQIWKISENAIRALDGYIRYLNNASAMKNAPSA